MALFENKKQLLMIVIAVGVGVAASILVAGYVTSRINTETQRLALQYEKMQKQKEQQYNEQLGILGQKIVEVQESSRRAAEDAARATAQSMQQQAAAAGSGAKPADDGAKKKSSLALKTPAGKRAVTVSIDSLGAVGGLISPGDFVDVIAQLDLPSRVRGVEKKDSVTAMIFQKLQILAINVNLDQPSTYAEQQEQTSLKITFAVNPQEAGLLSFAEKNGKLQLALRGPNENKNVMLSAATWSTLSEYVLENSGTDLKASDEKKVEDTGEKAKVEVQDVEEVKPYIQIFRGGREL